MIGAARTAAGAGAGAFVLDRTLTRLGVPDRSGWTRTNYRARPVSLTAGAGTALGSIAATVLTGPAPWRRPVLLAGLTAAGAGLYDDLVAPGLEHSADKGWRGHLAAARAGRPSGGVVKVAAIGVGSVLAAGIRPSESPGSTVTAAALVAGSANLLNLFDLRPGRAGKVALALAVPLIGGPAGSLAAGVAGATAAALPGDLGERGMLGDVGANTLGALLGLRLTALPVRGQRVALGVVLGLTALSEVVSFSRLIDRTAVLRRLDRWGRTAPAPGAGG